MYYFSRYELQPDGGDYSVRLYLDQSKHEFAGDFFGRAHAGETGEPGNLDSAARRYIREKLPGVRLKTAYILFGALLIATIPLTDADAWQAPATAPETSVTAPAAADGQQTSTLPAAPAQSAAPQPSASTPPVSSPAGKPQATQPAAGPGKTSSGSAAAGVSQSTLIIANKQHPLPAGFVPKNLTVPDVAFKTSSKEVRQMRGDAASALEQMFAAAEKDGVTLYAVSGYRSYSKQVAVFAASTKSHGSEEAANQYSARPGESEHQTGLAMDLTGASSETGLTEDFGSTMEGKWVRNNAWRFGFILRYPQGKESITGYQYEPWHVRYVGKTAAKEITDRGITLEEYEGVAS